MELSGNDRIGNPILSIFFVVQSGKVEKKNVFIYFKMISMIMILKIQGDQGAEAFIKGIFSKSKSVKNRVILDSEVVHSSQCTSMNLVQSKSYVK